MALQRPRPERGRETSPLPEAMPTDPFQRDTETDGQWHSPDAFTTTPFPVELATSLADKHRLVDDMCS